MTEPHTPARILVVDDELGVREGCRKILAAEGYDVVTAGDGKAGLEQLVERGPFSVLLVDLQMPRLSGLELMREARQRDPDVLPIIITAHATIDSAVEGTRQGAYSYIPKPFTPDELLLSIRNGLERRGLSLEARRLREDRERRMLELASERSRSTTILAAMMDGILVTNSERLVVLEERGGRTNDARLRGEGDSFPLDDITSPDVREIVDVVLGAPDNAPGAPGNAPGAQGFMILSRQIPLGQSSFMVNVSPVIEPDGSTSGAVAVFSDVTEMKKLDTAKSMFVSLVAHEVKSPLAASEGWLNLVLSGVLKQDAAEERRMLERARLRLRTLRGLVNEILSLTALQAGNLPLKRVPVDAGLVLDEVVENEREKAADRKIRITMERETSGPVHLLGDREALGMIYGNLVENAVKYSPDGGQVTIRVRRDGIYAAVSVADQGIGIAPSDCEKVFEEFYRVRGEATAAIPGTGLGLSLVKRLTELHQGTVSVESTLGEGSKFTVRVPLAAPPGT